MLIADEPTTALDAEHAGAGPRRASPHCSSSLGLALLLITHDMGVVTPGYADDVAVMYAGRIVESGPARRVLQGAPSTRTRRGLLAAVPLGRLF